MNGLFCRILKSKGYEKCANSGISERHDEVLLIGDGVDGPFSEEDAARLGRPVVVLVRRDLPSRNCASEYLHAVPKELGGRHSMAGGAFIYTSDSRFPCDYPISLHDRVRSVRERLSGYWLTTG
jgi:hypothetical protein